MGGFIFTEAFFDGENDETLGIETVDTGPFAFKLSEVEVFNESTKGYTTLGMKSGYRIIINMVFSDFVKMIENGRCNADHPCAQQDRLQ